MKLPPLAPLPTDDVSVSRAPAEPDKVRLDFSRLVHGNRIGTGTHKLDRASAERMIAGIRALLPAEVTP